MILSDELVSQVLSLPAPQRYELAQQLLDSIDEATAAQFDETFIAELKRRREEMLRGEEVVQDWRAALSTIERPASAESGG